jgi:DNA adenine methylase
MPHGKKWCVPFLKWAGGKRWLAPKLGDLLGAPLKARLVEPFLGSGAVFFFLHPERALLADTNAELVAAFRAVKDQADTVVRELSRLSINRSTFNEIRRYSPHSDVRRAVRLIYLNRTAFNGLYRVNRAGEFNVPFGCRTGIEICDPDAIRNAAAALKRATIRQWDFRKSLAATDVKRDVLYVDPPYTVKHDDNGFRRYNEQIFTWLDQKELAQILVDFARKGGRVVVSNAHHRGITSLYPADTFHRFPIRRASCMAADPSKRGTCAEWLFVSQAVSRSRPQILEILTGGSLGGPVSRYR